MGWQRPLEGYPRTWSEFVCENTKQRFVIKDLSEEYYDIALGYMTNIFLNESLISKPLKLLEDPVSRSLIQQKWLNIMKSNMAIICCTVSDLPRVAAIHFTAIRETNQKQMMKPPSTLNKYEQYIQVVDAVIADGRLAERFQAERFLWSMGLLVLPEFRGLGVGKRLLETRVSMCLSLGLQGTANVFSTEGARAAARSAGYQPLAEREYLGQTMVLMGIVVPSATP